MNAFRIAWEILVECFRVCECASWMWWWWWWFENKVKSWRLESVARENKKSTMIDFLFDTQQHQHQQSTTPTPTAATTTHPRIPPVPPCPEIVGRVHHSCWSTNRVDGGTMPGRGGASSWWAVCDVADDDVAVLFLFHQFHHNSCHHGLPSAMTMMMSGGRKWK